ncbi:MAG TPA: SagB/ThcOx family dehydrogenase [Syntrophales bacterium]|nr:SagB/ThcOx family dehydrogenase [Syntrophales bacterium]
MKISTYICLSVTAAVTVFSLVNLPRILDANVGRKMKSFENVTGKVIQLPAPAFKGRVSVEEALSKRESIRNFTSEPLTPSELSQVLWAAQGITRNWGGRTVPSAGALFPLEVYLVLQEGFFHYVPRSHQLIRISDQNFIEGLTSAALGQQCVRESPAIIVITAVYERIERKYGKRGERYVKVEAGHAGQNILLQAVSLGLGAVPVGAFYDDHVREVLSLPVDQEPLYLIPLGHPKE